MSKTLCDWSSKDIEKHLHKLALITAEPRYLCRKCARVANRSKHLCKPKRIPVAHPHHEGHK